MVYKIDWDALGKCETHQAIQEWLRRETEAQMKAYSDNLGDMRKSAQRRMEDLDREIAPAARRE